MPWPSDAATGSAIAEAMEELGLEEEDLEDLAPQHERGNIPVGEYPTLDAVFERAHEIASAE